MRWLILISPLDKNITTGCVPSFHWFEFSSPGANAIVSFIGMFTFPANGLFRIHILFSLFFIKNGFMAVLVNGTGQAFITRVFGLRRMFVFALRTIFVKMNKFIGKFHDYRSPLNDVGLTLPVGYGILLQSNGVPQSHRTGRSLKGIPPIHQALP